MPDKLKNSSSPKPRTASYRVRPPERHRDLLARLEEIVLAEGFLSLKIDDISSRLKCSKSTLYAIAPSKEQLVTEVMRRFIHDSERRIIERVNSIEDDRERLAEFFEAVHDQMKRMSRNCYDDMRSFVPTDELYRAAGASSVRTVRRLISAGVANGSFRNTHVDFISEAIQYLIEGVLAGRFMERLGMTDGEAYEEVCRVVLGGLNRDAQSIGDVTGDR